ncbi:hypothetical protein N7532_010545 [Penicillium argentinense]|uniref:Uncharacterized protein n=1 Tax=Penicillium argentinense TaxID=1131581 RepID=A0A9W9EPZ6_9EURO|nr:uncharacterized protein N7532_010545 [Penicillium argentinense]KAJ5085774.1 hypothetical protein N7532_010545 [Penicillium argentinense]
MGLIKTGLTLAGGYGLIKAASKAVNDHEEKKQKRPSSNTNMPPSPPQMPYHPGYNESQMGYMYQNQANAHSHPQWRSHEHQSHQGHAMNAAPYTEYRSLQGSQTYGIQMDSVPPSYGTGHGQMHGSQMPGSAQKYYSQPAN